MWDFNKTELPAYCFQNHYENCIYFCGQCLSIHASIVSERFCVVIAVSKNTVRSNQAICELIKSANHCSSSANSDEFSLHVQFLGTKLNNVAMDLKHLSVRKQKYVPKLKDCMYKRFDDILEKEDSFEVLKCLYTGFWPMESDDLKEYGLNEIEKLIFHFRVE